MRTTLALALLLSAAAGCGLKGDLVLPGEAPAQEQSQEDEREDDA